MSKSHRPRDGPWRSDIDDVDRGRVMDRGRDIGRRERSPSRERRRLSPSGSKRRHGGDTESHRSPLAKRKDHDKQSSSTRRGRSLESRRSNRHASPSPRRPSRRHRHDSSVSPHRHSTSHRHRHRHDSRSPPPKRRRSRSPGHSSSKHASKRSKRHRSRADSRESTRPRRRDASRSPRPSQHRSSQVSRANERELIRGRSATRSPPPPPLPPPLPRRGPPPPPPPIPAYHPDSPPPPSRVPRLSSPRRYSPHSPDRPIRRPSAMPPPVSRRQTSPLEYYDQAPLRRARSRSRSPYRDRTPPPLKRTRSPLPFDMRSPRPSQLPLDRRSRSPLPRPHSPPRAPKYERGPVPEKYINSRPGTRGGDYDMPDFRSNNRTPEMFSPPRRVSSGTRDMPDRTPRNELTSASRQRHPSPPYDSGRSSKEYPEPHTGPYGHDSRSRNPSYEYSRGGYRGRGRGRGRGEEYFPNRTLYVNNPRGRGQGPPSERKSGPYTPSQRSPRGGFQRSPDRPGYERRGGGSGFGATPRGPSRGNYSGGSGRGMGKARFFESHEDQPEPNGREDRPYRSEASPRQNGTHGDGHRVPESTGASAASAPPGGSQSQQNEMPPPSLPHSREGSQNPSQSARPFKRVVGGTNTMGSSAEEQKSAGFRPFSISLKNNKTIPKLTAVPKALDTGRNTSATGSNHEPLGRDRTRNVDTRRDDKVEHRASTSGKPKREPAKESSPPKPLAPPAVVPKPPVNAKESAIYHRVSMVGEGTYGKVYKASNNITKELVALKRIRMESEKDGFPITAVREMKLLQALKQENIIALLEVMVEKSDFYMVFEYMDHDLTGILNHPTFRLEPAHIKHLARQFFQALHYLHHRGVLHRDIKGSNILLNNEGQLKIADFGLARFYTKNSKKELDYTNRIITLWYRPPEILLGATAYGPAVDMWSAACVFIELFTRTPAFPGRTEIDQLDTIYEVLGKPNETVWPELKRMPWYTLLRTTGLNKKSRFKAKYEKVLPPSALDLAMQLLQYDPEKRPSAEDCLNSPYFAEEPAPAPPLGLRDIVGDWHEYESKMERRKNRDDAKRRSDAERRRARDARESEKKKAGQQEYDPERTIAPPASGNSSAAKRKRDEPVEGGTPIKKRER